jgi:hypothetical protein
VLFEAVVAALESTKFQPAAKLTADQLGVIQKLADSSSRSAAGGRRDRSRVFQTTSYCITRYLETGGIRAALIRPNIPIDAGTSSKDTKLFA